MRTFPSRFFLVLVFLIGFLLSLAVSKEAIQIPLWPNGSAASLLAFPAASPRKTSGIVICPGGAYGMLAVEKEGIAIAQWLNTLGISAFVLRYSLGPVYHHPVQMEEGKRAIRWVRSHAAEYHLDPKKIGMMGFSAGAHLTTTITGRLGEERTKPKMQAPGAETLSLDSIDRFSSRPNFQILIYPVISMEASYTHRASKINLLGQNPSSHLLHALSAEKNITSRTPPTFMVHAKTDPIVPFANSEAYYLACKQAKIPVELLRFESGGHAFGLGSTQVQTPELSTWPDSCARWMLRSGWF